ADDVGVARADVAVEPSLQRAEAVAELEVGGGPVVVVVALRGVYAHGGGVLFTEGGGGGFEGAGLVGVDDEELFAGRAGGGADEDADVAWVLGEPEPLAGEFFIAGVPLGERDRWVFAALVAGGGVVADADARALLQPGVVHGEDGEAVADEPQGAVEWCVADRCGAQGACSLGWSGARPPRSGGED